VASFGVYFQRTTYITFKENKYKNEKSVKISMEKAGAKCHQFPNVTIMVR